MAPTTHHASIAAAFVAAMLSTGPVAAQAPPPNGPLPYRLLTTPARAAALLQAARESRPYLPGEVLVKFRNGVQPAGQARALSALRSRPTLNDIQWIGPMALLRDPNESDAALLAQRLTLQPEVEYAEPNYLLHHMTVPDDPSYADQWNFTAIGVDRAWDINPGATGDVKVAVIDYGITDINDTFTLPTWDGSAIRPVDVPFKTSPDLAAARLTGGQDFVFWDGPVLDMDGHGTHVASTIGEDTNNTLAEAGIAYNATIMPLKACLSYWDVQFTISALGVPGFAPADAGGCPVSAVAEAIRYAADAGAAVINMSLGGPDQSIAIRDAMDYAVGKGTFIAVAMGNEYEEGNPVDYPAADAGEIEGAVAVTAVGRSLARAYYSNTGPHAEVAAPGGDYRQAGIPGLIWQVTIRPDDHEPSTVVFPRFDRYAEVPEQGTSMATPHVAGAAALLYSQGVTNPAVIEALLEATARDLGAAGRDEEYGFGLLQVRNALFGLGLSR